jgi:hypothetical protein
MRSCVLFLLLSCSLALGQDLGMPLGVRQAPSLFRNVVTSYCRMDYQGFRLTPDTWEKMKALTTWKHNPDWQGFTIVSQYDIASANEGLRSASVDIRYSVLGRFDPGIGYAADPHSETVNFRLQKADDQWKIEDQDPSIDPHLSKPKAIAWLKSALDKEKDPANRIAIQKALKALDTSAATAK